MSKNTWKIFENKICRMFKGQRRGADYADQDGGKNDCVGTLGWSMEIKTMKRPTWGIMTEDAKKAVARKEKPSDIGIAVMHKKQQGVPWKNNTYVVMTLDEFMDHFGDSE